MYKISIFYLNALYLFLCTGFLNQIERWRRWRRRRRWWWQQQYQLTFYYAHFFYSRKSIILYSLHSNTNEETKKRWDEQTNGRQTPTHGVRTVLHIRISISVSAMQWCRDALTHTYYTHTSADNSFKCALEWHEFWINRLTLFICSSINVKINCLKLNLSIIRENDSY